MNDARHALTPRRVFTSRSTTLIGIGALLLVTSGILATSAHALRRRPTWSITTSVEPDARAGGWFVNLGVTGARGRLEVESPTVIDVAYVFDRTPASGRLQVGDRILGANGRPFETPHKFGYGVEFFGYEGPMMDLGTAIEVTRGAPERAGALTLTVERDGVRREVELPIDVSDGAFGPTFPFDCERSRRTLERTRAYLASRQGTDGHWHRGRPHLDVFAALALLASGEAQYRPHVDRAARAFAAATDDSIEYEGLDCWKYTLYGIFLAEYHLATGEAWVLPELEEIDRWLRAAQMADGGWGHRPALRPGGNGYGSFCAMTAQGMLAWALMRRCGVEIDADRLEAASQFLARGTNGIGYVWYADEIGHPTNYADMGRTGTAAIAEFVAAGVEPRRLATATRLARCIGQHPTTFPDTHGSPIVGMVFTALGAGADPTALRQLLDANRWHFALAECADGTFYYQPNRDNNPQDYHAAPRLSATAATALILAMGERSLVITGGDPAPPAPVSNEPTSATERPQ